MAKTASFGVKNSKLGLQNQVKTLKGIYYTGTRHSLILLHTFSFCSTIVSSVFEQHLCFFRSPSSDPPESWVPTIA